MNVNMPRSPVRDTQDYDTQDCDISVLDEVRAAQMCAALADPVRLRLFLMVANGQDETCACDLVGPSGRSQPTVSHHMKVLVDAGLVQRTKRGQWVWYRVDHEQLSGLCGLLNGHHHDA
jgi:ArsR family transcriptional regulator, arsenate/arsenite/antimonite-responsive transcriptional repressor